MRKQRLHGPVWIVLVLCIFVIGPMGRAETVCDTDPEAVDFEAAVDTSLFSYVVSSMDDMPIDVTLLDQRIDGFCVNHYIDVSITTSLPLDEAMFVVSPVPGSLEVALEMPAATAAVRLSNYHYGACPWECFITGLCLVEEAFMEGLLDGEAGILYWDGITLSQSADTCVLGDCTPTHPYESTDVTIHAIDLDMDTDCEICFPFTEWCTANFCPGWADSFIGPMNNDLGNALVASNCSITTDTPCADEDGQWVCPIEGESCGEPYGMLIQAFSGSIVKDGCSDLDEVVECEDGTTVVAGVVQPPRRLGLTALLYMLPFVLAAGLWLGRRCRSWIRRACAEGPSEIEIT